MKTSLTRFLTLSFLCAASLGLSGCETGDDRQIAGAQSCLDTATDAATADACVAKIDGNSSADAYLIRCSANFIAQGITGTRLAAAFQSLKDDDGNGAQGTSMAKMAAYLVFNDQSAAHSASTTLSYCQASGVASMAKLAQAVAIASAIANLAGVTIDLTQTPDQIAAQFQTAIASLQGGSTTDVTSLGNTAIAASASMCTSGSTYESTDVCKTLSTAVASGDANAVGTQLLTLLHH